jgi:ParB family chromosome partitioning protein
MPLGRGLRSLIPSIRKPIKDELPAVPPVGEPGERILELPVDKISPNPMQPRENFAHQDLEDLINSIKEYGIIQPLIVSKIGPDDWQLIAGERRLRAAKILELKTVPAIVRQAAKQEKLELSLIENVQRKDLNPIERARAYQRLIDEFNFTQEEVAKKMGKSRPHVANSLRLLGLPEQIQKALIEEKITEAHAKLILSLDAPKAQLKAFKRILRGGWTVRETEQAIQKIKPSKGKFKIKDFAIQDKEERLREALGTKVEIKKKGEGGRVIIEFYSQEELERIIKKITG